MTTETAQPSPERSRRSAALRFAVAFVLGAVLVAVAGGAGLYAYGQQYNGRVLPGVRVGGTDLSGLGSAAAGAALDAAFAELAAGRILLAGPDGDVTIDYAEVGRRADTEGMLRAALAAGRAGEPMADLLGAPQTALRGVSLAPAVTYDPGRLGEAVAAVAEAIDRRPKNATLRIEEDGSYRTTPSVEGRVVDRGALEAAIAEHLSRVDAAPELRLDIPFSTATPAITTDEVEAAVAAADRMAVDLVLRRGEDSWTISGEKLRPLVSFLPAPGGEVAVVVDEAGVNPLLKPIAKAVNQPASNASFEFRDGRVVVAGESREGRRLDTAATRALVLATLEARRQDAPAPASELVLAITRPGVTTEEAKAIAPRMKKVSTWTTYFPVSEKNGFGANIWIPTRIIDGYVVGPGETFDFWDAVGPVTRERGYRAGGAIINGRTEPQGALAGGICSCSTTLFNAALRAGYEMGARRNHYYYIDRYPLGLDATVFISAGGTRQTMSFTNDTPYPLLIRGINTRKGNDGYVTFTLYSVPNGRTVNISKPTVKNVRQATDSVQYTSELPAGAEKRIEYPVDGKDVWRTVSVYQDGKLLRRTTYFSRYAVITGILLVGKGAGSAGDGAATP